MEIFHSFGVDWRLLIIQAVNFGVLMLALWAFLYKPLLKLMDERRAKIEKGVHDADAAALQLKEAEDKKRELMVAAAKEADALSERSRKNIAQQEKEASIAADEKAARLLAQAEKESAELKAQALVGAKDELAKMIVLGAEKVIRGK